MCYCTVDVEWLGLLLIPTALCRSLYPKGVRRPHALALRYIAYHFENVGNFCNFIRRQILQQRHATTKAMQLITAGVVVIAVQWPKGKANRPIFRKPLNWFWWSLKLQTIPKTTSHAKFDFDPTTWVVRANTEFVAVKGFFLCLCFCHFWHVYKIWRL